MSKSVQFWDKRSIEYDQAVKKHGPLFKKAVERSKALLNHTDKVLDFGCASGEYAFEIAPAVQHIEGIDSSPEMIRLAKEKTSTDHSNLKFHCSNLSNLSSAENTYSAVLAFNIFHLVENHHSQMKHMSDLLSPQGLVISKTPCLGERPGFLRFLINGAQKLGLAPAIQNFKKDKLEAIFTENGFKILESALWDEKQSLRWIVAQKI